VDGIDVAINASLSRAWTFDSSIGEDRSAHASRG
jgi:hypothetical protein